MLVHAQTCPILGAFSDTIPEEAALQLGVEIGSHRAQSAFEFLGLLVALRQFRKYFAKRIRVPKAKADSMAALGAAMKLASSKPAMNFLGAELSLLLEGADMADLEGEHLPGKLNLCADYPSRLMVPGTPPMPEALSGTKIMAISQRTPFALEGFGPGVRPDLWGKGEESAAGAEQPREREIPDDSRPVKRPRGVPRSAALYGSQSFRDRVS